MPSSITILCQIKSKGQDGGFISGLASYMIEQETCKILHYGFYKKQISLFLYDLTVGDYALLCGKCVFNRGIMYVSISIFYIYYLIKKRNESYSFVYYRYWFLQLSNCQFLITM